MNRPPTRAAIAAGAVALFFLSFLMSASGNALPQLFLQRQAPQEKAALLSLALLASTVAATLGVLLSRRLRLGQGALLAALVAVGVFVQALLAAQSVPAFIVLLVALQFLVNFLVDQVDHAAVARAGPLLAFGDTVGNAARLFGMLAAPAYFPLLAGRVPVERTGVAVLALGACAGAWALLRLAPQSAPRANPDRHKEGRPQAQDVVLFGFAIAVYAGMYLFAANAIYLLEDLLRIRGAETRGGALVVTVFAAAIVANGLAGLRDGARTAAVRTLVLLAPAVALAVAAVAPLAGLRPGYAVCVLASAAIGAGYGFFLRELRRLASAAARAGRGVVLGWFNNMANVSALLAFALMLLASRVAPGPSYYAAVLWAVVVLQAAGALLLWLGSRRGQREVAAPVRPHAP